MLEEGCELSVNLAMAGKALDTDVTSATKPFELLGDNLEGFSSVSKLHPWRPDANKSAVQIRNVASRVSKLAEAGIRLCCKPNSRTLSPLSITSSEINAAITDLKEAKFENIIDPDKYDNFSIAKLTKMEDVAVVKNPLRM